MGYAPVCPPEGESHRYVLTVYALSEQVTPPPETDGAAVRAAY